MARVVSWEIFLGKFPEIYYNLSGNFLNNFFHFVIFNYHHRKKKKNKHVFDKQLSRSLCFNLMH